MGDITVGALSLEGYQEAMETVQETLDKVEQYMEVGASVESSMEAVKPEERFNGH